MDNFETIFQLKVSINERLKEIDDCENYEKGEYESCLLKDIQENFQNILKCIPPWFTDSYDEKVNLSQTNNECKVLVSCSDKTSWNLMKLHDNDKLFNVLSETMTS